MKNKLFTMFGMKGPSFNPPLDVDIEYWERLNEGCKNLNRALNLLLPSAQQATEAMKLLAVELEAID